MIVVDRQGIFHKAKSIKESEIGAEVVFEKKESKWSSFLVLSKKKNVRIATMGLLCLLIVIPSFFWPSNNKAYAIVSLDINPSVNIEIDQEHRIIDIHPMNDDAETLVKNLEFENKTLTDITDEIIAQSRQQYELENDFPILMAVSFLEEGNDSTLLVHELENYFTDKQYHIAVYEVSKTLRARAEKENISLNQMTAQELEDEGTIVISSEKNSGDSENTQLTLPDLDEDERELIYNFYYEPSADQEDTSDVDESTNVEPASEAYESMGKDPVAELADSTDNDQSMETNDSVREEQASDTVNAAGLELTDKSDKHLHPGNNDASESQTHSRPPLPDQANDTAKENRMRNNGKSSDVMNKDSAEQKNKGKKDRKNSNNHAKQRGNGPDKSLDHPSHNRFKKD